MQKNTGFVDKTVVLFCFNFCVFIIHDHFELQQQNHMKALVSVALSSNACDFSMWMTEQEILTHAVLPLLALLAPTLTTLGIF